MNETAKKLNFSKNIIPKLILENNEEFKNHSIVSCSVTDETKTDGFMCSIYKMNLVLQDEEFNQTSLNLIVKLMKGGKEFREQANANVLCSNEVHIYKNVIPAYKKFLHEHKSTIDIENWIPKIYYADFKVFPELSEIEEAVLVMADLQPDGYRMGPRIDLDGNHLKLMIGKIAQFHAIYYSMKIKNEKILESLIDGLIPFDFKGENATGDICHFFHQLAWKRIFKVVKVKAESDFPMEFHNLLDLLKSNHWNDMASFMQSLLRKEEPFTAILHGDYNRNNVLFHYNKTTGFNCPDDVKMIDFQETRHATTAIDLSFFMYMNMPGPIREELWDSLLELYHKILISSISEILNCDKNDEILEPYNYEAFLKHFSKFAWYGVMISVMFIPWMACPEDECKVMSELFEKDMFGEKTKDRLMKCGGEDVDDRILSVVQHAFQKGYMNILKE